MKLILTVMILAMLRVRLPARCNCPVDCGTLERRNSRGRGPARRSGATAAALAGATAAAGSNAAVTTAGGTGVDPRRKPPPAPEKEYCASESGEVFHRCSCNSVQRIKRAKLVRLPFARRSPFLRAPSLQALQNHKKRGGPFRLPRACSPAATWPALI
ncbi:MAG: hypothetical protein MZU91_06990 [Desulfosudis oleivorans]|nr:hypothetical protein [Desulfosudis oleivorans]